MEFYENNIIEFGSSSSIINPKNKIFLDGFSDRQDNFQDIDLDISTKAFVFKIKNKYFSIVSVECLGLPESFENNIINRIKKRININSSDLLITYTHTHSAPKIKDITPTIFSRNFTNKERKQIDVYYKFLIDKVSTTILRASKKLNKCKINYSLGKVDFATNRRMFNGPRNLDLPIFYIFNLKEKLLAILFNYTCHCVSQKNKSISGDWAGYAQFYTEKYFTNIICMATIGCGADQNPKKGVGYYNNKFSKHYGKKIAKEIFKKSYLLNESMSGGIKSYYKKIYLNFQKIPSHKSLYGKSKFSSAEGYNANYQLKRLRNNKKIVNKLKYEIIIWKFLDFNIIFLPDEVCIDYFLSIKKLFKNLVIISYCKYLRGYIPSSRLLKEGGYGGGEEIHYFGLPSKFDQKIEKKIIKTIKYIKKYNKLI